MKAKEKMKQLLGIVTVFVLGIVDLQAAKVPMSQKELEKESNHIVSGKVISVTAKVQSPRFSGPWAFTATRCTPLS